MVRSCQSYTGVVVFCHRCWRRPWTVLDTGLIKDLFGEIMPSACIARAGTSFCNVIFAASFLQCHFDSQFPFRSKPQA